MNDNEGIRSAKVLVGGVQGFSGPYASFPFGRLEITDQELAIYGVGLAKVGLWRVGEVRVTRDEVDAVRVSRGFPGVKVTVVKSGSPVEPLFLALKAKPVLETLHAFGWPVSDTRRTSA